MGTGLRRARDLGWVRLLFCAAIALVVSAAPLRSQQAATDPQSHADSDGDGMSDALEGALLVQFEPSFMVGKADCSNLPAEFEANLKTPTPQAENGTIYGQVFPSKGAIDGVPVAEIHYYHLWRRDCGGHGHPLDTEHVSVLVRASDSHLSSGRWKAVYWYAAAHEKTVCDVSQIARASTLHAEDRGAKVWISPGKHASYLNETLCRRGCGADRCEAMTALHVEKIINLGETDRPMNGSSFIASAAWPLADKMSSTNFGAAPVARLNQLPDTDIAWVNPGRHPSQGIIAISSTTEQAIAGGGANTTAALSTAGDSTGSALSAAGDSTGNALQKSFHQTKHALGTSVRHVGKALGVSPKSEK